MSSTAERLFQILVIIAAIIPIAAGAAGIMQGPAMIRGLPNSNAEVDSHFSYLSGLLLGMGLAFVFCAATIDKRASTFKMLGWIVVVGGLARLFATTRLGLPSGPHRFAYGMELVVVPLLLLWLRRIECLPAAPKSRH